MMIKAKIKPSATTVCYACIDNQIDNDIKLDCTKCDKVKDCHIVQVGHSELIGDWAIVLMPNGTLERVKMDRLFDIKEG